MGNSTILSLLFPLALFNDNAIVSAAETGSNTLRLQVVGCRLWIETADTQSEGHKIERVAKHQIKLRHAIRKRVAMCLAALLEAKI